MATEATLQNLIEQNLPADQAVGLKLFAERLFARLSPELTARLDATGLYAIAQRAFEFFTVRDEEVAVRVLPALAEGAIVVESMMPDCAFIVDTVLECFRQLGVPVRMLLHPVINVSRDPKGRLLSIEQRLSTERGESFIHAELESPADSGPQIAAELRSRLEEVRKVTGDFAAMTSRALAICEETAPNRELVEVRDLLRWLVQGGFVFLGYRRYRAGPSDGRRTLAVELGSSLGILRDESRSRFAMPRPADQLDSSQHKLLFNGPTLIVGKTHAQSRVHRVAAMDDITIRRIDGDSQAATFDRFLGLLTSKAYAEEAEHIPVLRAKLREVLALEHAVAGSHDFKQIVAAFNSFPKEELFRASVAELRAQLGHVLDLKAETQVRLNLYPDTDRHSVIALVIMPRERFSAEVRMEIQKALAQGLGGESLYYHLALGEGYTARLHFCFSAPMPDPTRVAMLEGEVARLARTWEDRLREQLAARLGETNAQALASRWGNACGPDYQASTDVERAAADIERLEAMLSGGAPSVELGAEKTGGGEQSSELRIYELDKAPALSELMPILQNFGIRVLSEDAHDLWPIVGDRKRRASVQSFRVQALRGRALSLLPGASLLTDALSAVRLGRAENDPLNALTLEAALSWREAALVRAYLAGGLPDAACAGASRATPRAAALSATRAGPGRSLHRAARPRSRRSPRAAGRASRGLRQRPLGGREYRGRSGRAAAALDG